MKWTPYRNDTCINGVSRRHRILIAVLAGGLDVVRTAATNARVFLPLERQLSLDDIDVLFEDLPDLCRGLHAVLGAEDELARAAERALTIECESTVRVWERVLSLPDLVIENLKSTAGGY